MFKLDSDKIGIIVSVVSIFIFFTLIFFALNEYIWCDEAYTLELISNSYHEVIFITAEDVHPPFYYLLLKSIFSILIFLKINYSEVIIGKIVSILPIVLLLIFNFTVIRKKFGYLSAGLFSLLLIGMPKMILYGFQLRMYSWSLLFLILTFYYAYEITRKPKPKTKTWIYLILFSLLGAYTNYFTLINIVVIYILLFAFIIRYRRKTDPNFSVLDYLRKNKQKKGEKFSLFDYIFKTKIKINKYKMKKLIISIVAIILLYLPWLFILSSKSQTTASSSQTSNLFQFLPNAISYKISSQGGLSFDFVPKVIMFIFSPDFHRTAGDFSIFGVILFIAILVLIIYSIFRNNEYENKFIYLGPLVLLGTILLAFIASSHNFSERYVFTSLGVFWLSISLLLSKNFDKKSLFVPIFIIILIISSITIYGFIEQQKEHSIVYNDVNEILNEIGPNDLVVSTNSHIYVEFSYYLKNNHILYDFNYPEFDSSNYTYSEAIKFLTGWTAPPKSDDPDFLYNKQYILEKIEKTLQKNGKVWILTNNTRDEVYTKLISKINEKNIKITEKTIQYEKYPDESRPYPKKVIIISSV